MYIGATPTDQTLSFRDFQIYGSDAGSTASGSGYKYNGTTSSSGSGSGSGGSGSGVTTSGANGSMGGGAGRGFEVGMGLIGAVGLLAVGLGVLL